MTKSWQVPKDVIGQQAPGKLHFLRPLVEFCRDLQDDRDWTYKELPPVQLLKSLQLDGCPTQSDELARAEWLWTRRAPPFLSAISILLWLMVALGMPLWLRIPEAGIPVLTVWAVMVCTEIVRTVHWRRDYEHSIARLIRISGAWRGNIRLERQLAGRDANDRAYHDTTQHNTFG